MLRLCLFATMHTSLKRFQGILYALLSSASFGMIPMFAVPALRSGMSTTSVLFYRMAFSAVLMGLLVLVRKTDMRITRRQLFTIIGLSVFYMASSLFLLESYLYIPSGIATTIHFLYPVFVTMLMVSLFHEKLSAIMMIAIALAVGGVYLLSSGNSGGSISMFGVGIVLITVVAYGSYIVGVKQSCASRVDGLAMTFYVLFFTALQCGVNVLFHGEGLDPIPGFGIGLDLVLLGLIPTLVSNLFLILAIHKVGSTITAVLGCMEPLTAVAVGVLFLGEEVRGLQYFGIVVILVAVALVILGNRRKAAKVEA